MAYVYRHIRLDKNEPFYIGIGSQDNYSRAYSKSSRNNHWHNIVKRAGYEVQIMLDELSWEESQLKEIEFISIYGRRDNGGILCNRTDGGEGATGLLVSEETRRKQSLKKKGKPSVRKGIKIPQYIIDAMAKGREGKDVWNKGKKLSDSQIEKMRQAMKGKPSPMKGKCHSEELKQKWSKERKGVSAWNKGMKGQYKMPNQVKRRKIVIQLSLNGLPLNEYESATAAANSIGGLKGGISAAATNRTFGYLGYLWKYK